MKLWRIDNTATLIVDDPQLKGSFVCKSWNDSMIQSHNSMEDKIKWSLATAHLNGFFDLLEIYQWQWRFQTRFSKFLATHSRAGWVKGVYKPRGQSLNYVLRQADEKMGNMVWLGGSPGWATKEADYRLTRENIYHSEAWLRNPGVGRWNGLRSAFCHTFVSLDYVIFSWWNCAKCKKAP